MRTLATLLAALGLLAAGCGDDGDGGDGNNPDGVTPDGPNPDGPDPDAPPPASFTSFVIDLVTDQTANNTEPRPFADFSDLDDPDEDNPGAYDGLFP